MSLDVEQAVYELSAMIVTNKSYRANYRYVFLNKNGTPNQKALAIGMQLHEQGGDAMLHDVMNRMMNFVEERIKAGKTYLVFDLRQLECCWNGIGDWMC